jgi:alkane 1-monooxygenase
MKFRVRFHGLLYLLVFTLALASYRAFYAEGWLTVMPILYAYGLIPILEALIPEERFKLSESEQNSAQKDPFFDWIVYLIVPVQFALLGLFLYRITQFDHTWIEYAGMTLSMGLCCGVLGINVAHELGHRVNKGEQFLGQSLLLTSLYMHFFIEHNEGHHKRVATDDDPATARLNESVYAFWFRCIAGSWFSAWDIEQKRLARKKASTWSLQNRMIRFVIVQLAFIGLITLVFGPLGGLFFIAAALVGILHLECVNYIEHYGLMRNKVSDRRYENTMPWHSWNSNKVIGRYVLFELTRHSDHHYKVHKKYQTLESLEEGKQLPMGYPAAILLSLIPPLWYRKINPLITRS